MLKRNATVQKTVDFIAVDRSKMLKLYQKVFGTKYTDATAIDIAYQMGRNDEKSGRPVEPRYSYYATY